jgi:lysozyme
MLSGVRDTLRDDDIPLSQRAADAETIAGLISMGVTQLRDQSSQSIEQAKLKSDAVYKAEQIRIAQQNANSRAALASASGQQPPPIVDVPIEGGTQKMQWNKESQSYVPIVTSGLNATSTAATGSNLTDLVKGLEGFNPQAYGDYKQTSIGYGTKGKPGEVLTKEQATERLNSELSLHAKRIEDAAKLKGISLNLNQFNALASFDFNTGKGADLIKRFGDKPQELANKMLEYTKAGGKELPGLVKRRQIEAALFLSPASQQAAAPQAPAAQGRVGFKPDELKEPTETFRPATAEESKPFGGVAGQVSNLTGRFYPDKPSSAELKLQYLEQAAAAYSAGDKQKALRLATAAGVGGLFGNLTIQDLDDYFMAASEQSPVATPETPVQGGTPQTTPATRRPIDTILPK